MIIARAPYRISFLGGGTDFPLWYLENNGAVISTTIDKYCHILVRWLPPFFEHKYRIAWSHIELPSDINDILHPTVREALKFLNISDGVEVHHVGDLPAKTGMGTSSSFTVALLHSLYTLLKVGINHKSLAETAVYVEQELCKSCVGSQDQTASAYGGFNRINFTSDGISVVSLNSQDLEKYLMLYFTGFQRFASTIEKEKLSNMEHNKHNFKALYDLVGEGEKMLESNNMIGFGELIHEGWMIKRDMSPSVSTDYIDFLYDKALKAGAVGGKLLGAGGGGFLLLLVEPDKQEAVRKVMNNTLQVPFSFENKGSHITLNNGSIDS